MERLTIREIETKSELLYWFLLNSSSKKVKELVKAITADGLYELKLTVNGVELPILESFKDLEKQDEERINKAAFRLIKEKLNQLDDVVNSMTDQIKRDFAEKLNIHYEGDL